MSLLGGVLLESDGAEYTSTRQNFVNAVLEKLETRIPKSGGYDGLGGKDNQKKRMIRLLVSRWRNWKRQSSFVRRHCLL